MGTIDFVDNKITKEMNQWAKEEYSYIVAHLARLCTCNPKNISCVQIYPGDRPGYDCGFVFFGPKDIMLGEIRWNKNGKCTDFIRYDDNIIEARDMLARRRAESARNKSVNRSKQQAKEREISAKNNFIKKAIRDVVLTAALVGTLVCSFVSLGQTRNPDYANDAYNAGYEIVSVETHRTNDNQGYWYDYVDIAESYEEDYDFDSWVYGVYKNVGWNQQSKLSCMDELFRQLEVRGITEYNSFLEYCDSKGVCVEKDGKLVIDTGELSKTIEEYMISLNSQTITNDDKKTNFRIG